MDSVSKKNHLILQKNPLLINTIVNDVLRLMPLNDMKQCRLVCHQWNSIAEPLLRKKAKIRFSHSFHPADFIEYSRTHLPDLPFTAFKFSAYRITIEKLTEFFHKWGDNIKSLEFQRLHVWTNDYEIDRPSKFDLNPLIDLVAAHLVELKVCSCNLNISLDNLSAVKVLSLINCEVNVNSTGKRIAPSKVYLQNVKFLQQGTKRLFSAANNYVDFSKCSEIQIVGSFVNEMSFDMSRDISNVKKIVFDDICLFNWSKTNANIDCLKLSRCSFADEETRLKTKYVEIKLSAVDLALLPNTIEKLTLTENKITRNDNVPINFPHLKHLKYLPQTTFLEDGQSARDVYQVISQFANCLQLVDLELGGRPFDKSFWEINLSWLPKSVKRLKFARSMKFKYLIGDHDLVDLDVLILEYSSCDLARTVLKKIKPKILVVNIIRGEKETTDDLTAFVIQNQHLEKIIVELHEGSMKNSTPFEKTAISKYVDQKSLFYEFKNQFGTSITQEEFRSYSMIK